MPIHVLLVDDSAVVRGLMSKALTSDSAIAIAGSAANGAIAIAQARQLQPDIIILDIEMPVMDGITALPELLKVAPNARVIMASTLTMRNAAISMQAMALGASDYLAKPSAKFGNEVDAFYRELIAKVKALSEDKAITPGPEAPPAQEIVAAPPKKEQAKPVVLRVSPFKPEGALNPAGIQALAIASSTGGPQALISLFSQLKGRLTSLPVFITQHMPPNFTTILADHISKSVSRSCVEVKGGETVMPGHIYLAPGDYHMVAQKQANGHVVLSINQDPPENYCRPAADPMLRSLAHVYGRHLAVAVLTGMGQDGMEGAKEVVKYGGSVIAQDEASCVVYGMPKAVVDNKLARAVLPLGDIAPYLVQQVEGRRL